MKHVTLLEFLFLVYSSEFQLSALSISKTVDSIWPYVKNISFHPPFTHVLATMFSSPFPSNRKHSEVFLLFFSRLIHVSKVPLLWTVLLYFIHCGAIFCNLQSIQIVQIICVLLSSSDEEPKHTFFSISYA